MIFVLVISIKYYWVEQASSQKLSPFPVVGNGASGVERESFSGSTVFIRWQSVIGECVLLTMTILGPGNVPFAYFSGSRCIPLSSALAVDEICSQGKIMASILIKLSYYKLHGICFVNFVIDLTYFIHIWGRCTSWSVGFYHSLCS